MKRAKPWELRTALAIVWAVFTVALGVWLFIFYFRLFDAIEALNHPEGDQLLRHSRMIAYELVSLIFALVLGAAGLFYLIALEKRRTDQIHQFFAVFSHELKTSLARLRIQSERLQTDLRQTVGRGGAMQLLDDVAKLEVQLENSLWIARADEDRFLPENLTLSQMVSDWAHQYPLMVHLSSEAVVRLDRRVLESLFKNLLQNAVVHGKAQNLWLNIEPSETGFVTILIRDDGEGFQGDTRRLGQLFFHEGTSSGSGLGLYLIKKLCKLSGGEAHFTTEGAHFIVRLRLPGSCDSQPVANDPVGATT